mmetsp:Transcript_20514/g.57188  ORF Transcript_20514/g.57188 Transcript_20514/m.57188 type:complete len:153 (+) Transcript_20514:1471-1929(+)
MLVLLLLQALLSKMLPLLVMQLQHAARARGMSATTRRGDVGGGGVEEEARAQMAAAAHVEAMQQLPRSPSQLLLPLTPPALCFVVVVVGALRTTGACASGCFPTLGCVRFVAIFYYLDNRVVFTLSVAVVLREERMLSGRGWTPGHLGSYIT